MQTYPDDTSSLYSVVSADPDRHAILFFCGKRVRQGTRVKYSFRFLLEVWSSQPFRPGLAKLLIAELMTQFASIALWLQPALEDSLLTDTFFSSIRDEPTPYFTSVSTKDYR